MNFEQIPDENKDIHSPQIDALVEMEGVQEKDPSNLVRIIKKYIALAFVGAAPLIVSGCNETPNGTNMESKPKIEHVDAQKVIEEERAADEAVMGYLELISGNSVSGNRLERDVNDVLFIELHGNIYKLSTLELYELRSILIRNQVSPADSKMKRTITADIIKKEIDLEITAHAEKITDPSALPLNIRNRLFELEDNQIKK